MTTLSCACGASLENVPLHRTQPFSAPNACYSCLACIQKEHPEFKTDADVRINLSSKFYNKECPLCFSMNKIDAFECNNCIWEFGCST